MKNILLIFTIGLLFLFQLVLSDLVTFSIGPNMVLLFLCAALMFMPISEVVLLSFLGGLFLDFFSGLPDGVLVLSLPIAITGAYYLIQKLPSEKFETFILALYVIVATMIFSSVSFVINYIFYLLGLSDPMQSDVLTYKLGISAVLNLVLLYPVLWAYNLQAKLLRFFDRKNESIRN
ncbi:MAG: hypothetical protein KW793_01065 [Candidatus Doudnabacteria bacterium]|nr:hypothetical protein [Candidatus Doudnabacteria bacterium]